VIGTVSLASIVGLAWSIGGYNQALWRVVETDTGAVLCFLVAAALRVIGARGKAAAAITAQVLSSPPD
jgi:hypothetical protein